MKQHTEKMYLYLRPRPDNDKFPLGYELMLIGDSFIWHTYSTDIKLVEEPIEITCQYPDFTENELRLKAVNTLRERQKRVRQDAWEEELRLQKEIDKLLLLEHKSESETPEDSSGVIVLDEEMKPILDPEMVEDADFEEFEDPKDE